MRPSRKQLWLFGPIAVIAGLGIILWVRAPKDRMPPRKRDSQPPVGKPSPQPDPVADLRRAVLEGPYGKAPIKGENAYYGCQAVYSDGTKVNVTSKAA